MRRVQIFCKFVTEYSVQELSGKHPHSVRRAGLTPCPSVNNTHRSTSVLARTPTGSAGPKGAHCLRCNSPVLQFCSLARALFFSFYIFTLSDKAPVAFSIMLCRCSQQERVIALGVWSSLRRIGSSGQSCQGLPEDSPGCVYMRVCIFCVSSCHTAARITLFHFTCACPGRRHARPGCVFAYGRAWETICIY